MQDTDVVQHRAGGDQPGVKFRRSLRENRQRLVPNLRAVLQEQPAQRRLLRVKIPDDFQRINIRHHRSSPFRNIPMPSQCPEA